MQEYNGMRYAFQPVSGGMKEFFMLDRGNFVIFIADTDEVVFVIPGSRLHGIKEAALKSNTVIVSTITSENGRFTFRSSVGDNFDCTEYLNRYDLLY